MTEPINTTAIPIPEFHIGETVLSGNRIIGTVVAVEGDYIYVKIPPKHKRKYLDHPGWYQLGGTWKFLRRNIQAQKARK